MQITLHTVGTRGDVQPYIALGIELHKRGHSVRIATHEFFHPWIRRTFGLEPAPITGNPFDLLRTYRGKNLLQSGKNSFSMFKHLYELAQPLFSTMYQSILESTQDADVLIHHILTALPAQSIAEARGIPAFPFYLQPIIPTKHYPSPIAQPLRSLPFLTKLYNTLTYRMSDWFAWKFLAPHINEFRKNVLKLPSYTKLPFPDLLKRGLPFFIGISPHVYKPPPDWPEHVYVTGYWFLDTNPRYSPPEDLQEFLEKNPRPIAVGFGSIPLDEVDTYITLFDTVCRELDIGCVFISGWSKREYIEQTDHTFIISDIPHEWLFPRVHCVVHHGGVSTTAQAFRTGIPQIVCPLYTDQFFWAHRVIHLGTGKSIPFKKLSIKKVKKVLEHILHDPVYRKNAENISHSIQQEQGVVTAISILEHYLPV